MEEKIPVIRLKKAAKEKLLNQYPVTLLAYLLQIGLTIIVFLIFAMALSGTVLAPLMQKLLAASSENDIIQVEEDIIAMTATPKYYVISELISAFMGSLFATLSTGYIRICLKISRTETASVKDLFYVYKHNPDRAILIYLLTFAIQLVIGLPCDILSFYVQKDPDNTPLYLVYMLLLTASVVITVIFSLSVAMTFYLYVDNPDMPVMEVFRQSLQMMKGNKGRLFSLEVSFLGWVFFTIMTCGVLTIWIVPYLQMTLTEFYRTTKGESLWISTSNYQGNLE